MNTQELTRFGFGYGHTFADAGKCMTIPELAFCQELPHGSGIDYDWNWYRQGNGKLVLTNAYHGMDECGFYVGSVDFSVVVDDLANKDFRVVFHTSNRYWVNWWMLPDYLGEMFYYAMERANKVVNDAI